MSLANSSTKTARPGDSETRASGLDSEPLPIRAAVPATLGAPGEQLPWPSELRGNRFEKRDPFCHAHETSNLHRFRDQFVERLCDRGGFISVALRERADHWSRQVRAGRGQNSRTVQNMWILGVGVSAGGLD